MSLYPRLLWSPDGVEITVQTAEDEAARVAEGYHLLPPPWPEAEPVVTEDAPTFGAADDGTGEGPTEGPPDDETHAKPTRKKKG